MELCIVANPEWFIPDPDPGPTFSRNPDPTPIILNMLEIVRKYIIINQKEESTICYDFKGTFHCIFCTIKAKKE